MELFNQLQAAMQGNQAGNAMSQGMMPSVSQPRGSQQLWIHAIGATREEISRLAKLSNSMRITADPEFEDCEREVTKCTHILQGVLDKLRTKMTDMQQGAMQNAA